MTTQKATRSYRSEKILVIAAENMNYELLKSCTCIGHFKFKKGTMLLRVFRRGATVTLYRRCGS